MGTIAITPHDRNDSTLWQSPPSNLILAANEVHVWRVWLNLPSQDVERLARLLSPDEVDRANRFHFARDRTRFIIGRGSLRMILSRYQQTPPDKLVFEYSAHGKPALTSARKAVNFNVSHSEQLLLAAVSAEATVGIDLEYIRPLDEFQRIAERTFSTVENKTLRTVPESQRLGAFFTCWTRKEAFIKAVGQGLSYPLDQFDVSLKPGDPAALLRIRPDPQAEASWSMQAIDPGPGYVGALVVDSHVGRSKFWQWHLPAGSAKPAEIPVEHGA